VRHPVVTRADARPSGRVATQAADPGAWCVHALCSSSVAMTGALRWFVVIIVVAMSSSGCWSGKPKPPGTNLGQGSDQGGPWTQGSPPAVR
jgi:hypothetical protein